MQLSYDSSALSNYSSAFASTRSVPGIGGDSTIVPVMSPGEAYGYFWTREVMNAFVTSLWQCDRVVSCKPHAMMNAWGKLSIKDVDPELTAKANRWLSGLKKKYCHGQILANKDGGATIIRFVDDGRVSDEPIDLENIKKVRYSRVFDRWECYPDPLSYQSDPTNPEFYLVSVNPMERIGYSLNDQYKDTYLPIEGRSYLKIHRDRIVRFDGSFIDADSMVWNQGWHASSLIRFLPPCLRYLEAMGYVVNALKSFEMVLFLVDDLFKMLSTDKGKGAVIERSRLNQQMLNAIRGMVVDRKKEDVKVVSRSFQNTDKVIAEARKEMKGASGLDDIELFNEHPTGMNQTGQSQRKEKARQTAELCAYHWGELMEGNQTEDKLGDADLYLQSQESPFNSVPENYDWEWSEDIAVTPEEKAKIYVYYSQGDRNYRDSGVLTPEDTRSRFEGDKFSDRVTLDDDSFKKQQESKQQSQIMPTNNEENNKEQNRDGVEKLEIDPLESEILGENEYEQLLREVENEGDFGNAQ